MSTLRAIEREIVRRHIEGNDRYLDHLFGTGRDGWLTTERDVWAESGRLERVRDIGRRRYRRFADAVWPSGC